MGFMIYCLILSVNPMGRIMIRWKGLRNNLEILCHPNCHRLYQYVIIVITYMYRSMITQNTYVVTYIYRSMITHQPPHQAHSPPLSACDYCNYQYVIFIITYTYRSMTTQNTYVIIYVCIQEYDDTPTTTSGTPTTTLCVSSLSLPVCNHRNHAHMQEYGHINTYVIT